MHGSTKHWAKKLHGPNPNDDNPLLSASGDLIDLQSTLCPLRYHQALHPPQ